MTDTAPPPSTHEDDQPLGLNTIALRIMAVLGVLSMFVWIGAILIGPGIKPIGQLEDTTFPVAAEKICASWVARYDELPNARDADTVQQRSDTIYQTADIFTEMTAELSDAVPATDDAGFINEWIADWNIHIDDRTDYADRLLSDGPDEVFLETTKVKRQISNSVNRYAEINHMESCSIPGDL